MTGFRALVVDDEPLARAMIVSLLEADAEFYAITELSDPTRVIETVDHDRPHIVFLDIEMPERTGLQIAADLADRGPVVVFVTAFDQHACRAFDVSAVDYVLKPFTDERFAEAVSRAKRRVRERRLGELANQMAALSAELSLEAPAEDSASEPYLQRLAFKAGDRTHVVRVSEIVWIEAEDYYVLVHSTRGRHMVRVPMSTLEARLDPRHFVRVHRGAIVNVDEIRELHDRDGLWLTLSDGTKAPVSRSRRRLVEPLVVPRLR
jgi:two-component system, LytTR family, response regulator